MLFAISIALVAALAVGAVAMVLGALLQPEMIWPTVVAAITIGVMLALPAYPDPSERAAIVLSMAGMAFTLTYIVVNLARPKPRKLGQKPQKPREPVERTLAYRLGASVRTHWPVWVGLPALALIIVTGGPQ